MKVRATKPGVFRIRRRPGDVFDVPEGTNLGSWLEEVKEGEEQKPRKKRKVEPKPPETFSELTERDKDTLA